MTIGQVQFKLSILRDFLNYINGKRIIDSIELHFPIIDMEELNIKIDSKTDTNQYENEIEDYNQECQISKATSLDINFVSTYDIIKRTDEHEFFKKCIVNYFKGMFNLETGIQLTFTSNWQFPLRKIL